MPRSYPDRETLMDVIVDYLEGELYPKLSGVDRYRSRVAINALRIVQREMTMGPSLQATDAQALRELLGASQDDRDDVALEETLADDIAQGRRSLDDPALVSYLRDSLRRALQVNNPKWTGDAPAS